MKTKIFDVLRWVISPILAACLFAFWVTPAYPAKPAVQVAQPSVAASAVPASTEIAELSKQVDELKNNGHTLKSEILELKSKTIDWQLSFLSVIIVDPEFQTVN
ncbi:MAG: hypothetical protein PHU06_03960 [Gallionella sp.]|nr:hypothetical protein [Gallionella sp.]MDD4958579.1 hypothetical protein [Gallionella sp.]